MFSTLPVLLEKHPRFQKSKLVKIDTDGFDGKIIRGAEAWLAKHRPVLFFEYAPYWLSLQGDDGLSIFQTLERAGYARLLVYRNTGGYEYSISLSNKVLLQEMHEYVSRPSIYFDLCAFHVDDAALAEQVRLAELDFFRKARGAVLRS